MRALLASPLGLVVGIALGALGGGGSIIAVPALVYGAGQDARAATTTSLVVVGAAALAGLVGHVRAGRVHLRAGGVVGLVGLGGSFAGSMFNRVVPGRVLLLGFAGLMLVAAWRMWPRSADAGAGAAPPQRPSARSAPQSSTWRVALRVAAVGTGVGFLTGFFGVGGGFVIVPGLVLALGYELPEAVGTSLLVISINSAAALVFRLPSGRLAWSVVVPFTIAALVGAVLGARLAGIVPPSRLSRWFVWLLLALAAYVAVRTVAAG